MKFRIAISGSHTEGPEAKGRFEKLTRDYLAALISGGFVAEHATASADIEGDDVDFLAVKHGDPEPASWQAAVQSLAERAPAVAEAATVDTLNADAISKADERIADAKMQPTTGEPTVDDDVKDRSLEKTKFATQAAQKLAAENGLTDAEFKKWNPTPDKDGFTLQDVRDVIAGQEEE